MGSSARDVAEYIAALPEDQAEALSQVRSAVLEVAPDAEEAISYGMPGTKLRGRPLVYFAAFKHHVGFYPLPSGIASFAEELAGYKRGKGSVQFPLGQPMPLDLIKKIVRQRVAENEEAAAQRRS